jgi:hypothetical protein
MLRGCGEGAAGGDDVSSTPGLQQGPDARLARLVLLPCTWLVWIFVISCGGTEDGDAPRTGVRPNDASTTGMSNDASTTETPDGGADENDSRSNPDAPEVGDDAANEPDVMIIAPTDNEVCHVVWPQPRGLIMQPTPSGLQLATDPAGNAYFALTYEGFASTVSGADDSGVQDGSGAPGAPATLDLGVSSPGYPQGVAVAKVDAQCNLLWMREVGVTDAATSVVQSVGIGVDANSNVTVLGLVSGSADLGAETADAAPIVTDAGGSAFDLATFLLRIDAAGNFLFSKVFRSTDGFALAVAPNGVSTIVAQGAGADFGNGPIDAGSSWGFAQFDTTGTLTLAKALASGLSIDQLLADPNGGFLASGSVNSDAGVTPSMMRLSAAGDVLWSRSLTSGQLIGVNATAEVAAGAPSSGNLSEDVVTAYSPDGILTSSRVTWVSYVGDLADQVVLDTMGDTIVGGDFRGTPTTLANGSQTLTDAPAGAGFQRFDSSGALRSFTTWGGADERFGAVGVAPDGNVLLLGWDQPPADSAFSSVFFARFVP